MNVFARRYLGRSQFVEGLVEEWKRAHDQAMFASAVEELAGECIDLGNLSKHAWKLFRELLVKDPNAPIIDESGMVMQEALVKTTEIFQTMRGLVAEAIQKGHSIRDVATLDSVFREIKEIKDKVDGIFMEPDPKLTEESLAEYERGEYYTAEELYRAAQDGRFPPD